MAGVGPLARGRLELLEKLGEGGRGRKKAIYRSERGRGRRSGRGDNRVSSSCKKKLLDYLHRGGVVETGHLRGETHFGLTRRKLSPSWQFRLCPFGGSKKEGKGRGEKRRCLAFAFPCTLQTRGPQLHSVSCIRPPILQRGPLGALRSAQRPRHAWKTKRCFLWRCLPQRLRRGALAFSMPWNYSDYCRVLPELS